MNEKLLEIAKDKEWELDYLSDGSPIFQSSKLYTFTSDSVVLAKFVDEEHIGTLVDFCSGSGIVGLEVAGRIKTDKLVQFEIQEGLAEMASYTNQYNESIKNIELYNCSLVDAEKYVDDVDVVVCNPPYFKLNSGKMNESSSRSIARHEISVSLNEIIVSAKNILKNGGALYFVHIQERYNELVKCAKQNGFVLEKKELLAGTKLKRFLIKLRLEK